jgi:mercuric ion binding protein
MKTSPVLLSLITFLFFSISSFAQKTKTENIKVWGNCSMCKKTIETAAKNAGVTEATWSPETKVLAVSYDPRKLNNQKIQKAVAASGYDTQDFTAPAEAYESLHECCQYDRKADSTVASAVKKQSCCETKECKKGETCCKDAGGAKDCCKDATACTEKGCCKQ